MPLFLICLPFEYFEDLRLRHSAEVCDDILDPNSEESRLRKTMDNLLEKGVLEEHACDSLYWSMVLSRVQVGFVCCSRSYPRHRSTVSFSLSSQ